ncbi:hypothetical protein MKX50_04975 [Paenibacillus sp. FSL W8-0186]|uniref:hypothetical protein n=1 Tax=Paenibacillus sp. FSL W8-0186 TaxID=2921709 RepID=UPI0030D33E33
MAWRPKRLSRPTDWTNLTSLASPAELVSPGNLTNPADQAEVEAIKAGNRGEMEILADFLNMRE